MLRRHKLQLLVLEKASPVLVVLHMEGDRC